MKERSDLYLQKVIDRIDFKDVERPIISFLGLIGEEQRKKRKKRQNREADHFSLLLFAMGSKDER
uniref:Uncharacterized protein n=1 Tax=Nelumbo nucifera TaxID=4432 RepID=A0A822ZT34_NELNU|nr:TPA_asm: hypothetical protein HUJ06_017617 [Nelumbo nucifera]